MVSFSEYLVHPWLTKKRKVMLIALLVFVICTSAFKWESDAYVAHAQPTGDDRSAVRAGGYICNSQYQAAGQARLKELPGESLFEGCSQIGAILYVNVFDDTRIYINGFEVVKIGNAGGVGWVETNDLQ